MALPAPDERPASSGKAPAFYLDFDGVLAPIVAQPDDATVPPKMQAALNALSAVHPVYVISGRARIDVARRVGEGITCVGCHGLDADPPLHPVPAAHKTALDAAVADLRRGLVDLPGVHLEVKPCSVAIHRRRTPEHRKTDVVSIVENIVGATTLLRIVPGKEVQEVVPALAVNKGTALQALHARHPERVPVVLGDDVTDEDAFAAALELDGTAILVTEQEQEQGQERPTAATHVLHPDRVAAFLAAAAVADDTPPRSPAPNIH